MKNDTALKSNDLTLARYESVALALMQNSDIAGAVKQAKISRSTLARIQREPAFQAIFREIRGHVISAALANLSRISAKAVKVLEQVLDDTSAPPYARAGAAGKILDIVLKIRETDDLEQQISEIRETLKSQGIIEGREANP